MKINLEDWNEFKSNLKSGICILTQSSLYNFWTLAKLLDTDIFLHDYDMTEHDHLIFRVFIAGNDLSFDDGAPRTLVG